MKRWALGMISAWQLLADLRSGPVIGTHSGADRAIIVALPARCETRADADDLAAHIVAVAAAWRSHNDENG